MLYGLNGQLPLWTLVVTAAAAAALGRFALAWGCRLFASRLPQHLRDNLEAARIALHRRSHNIILALGLFLLSPLPSAQLFMAVGLARVPLLGFTAAFFVGRLVTYSLYGWTARKLQQSSIGDAFMETLSSPWGILLQVTMLAALVALVRIDHGVDEVHVRRDQRDHGLERGLRPAADTVNGRAHAGRDVAGTCQKGKCVGVAYA